MMSITKNLDVEKNSLWKEWIFLLQISKRILCISRILSKHAMD